MLGCLRLVTCAQTTQRHVPDDLRAGAYAAWERAREHIHSEWSFSTDPANVQPQVSSLLRRVAQHLRTYPPNIGQEELTDALNSVEAPLSPRNEKSIRDVFNQELADPLRLSSLLVDKVRELGLQPFQAPDPLPPIERDEIQLIAWMAIDH